MCGVTLYRSLLWICILIAVCRNHSHAGQIQASESSSQTSDFACGPRCVLEVLRHFGRGSRLELSDLIDECMENDRRQGASLLAMSRALGKRGICTTAVAADGAGQICWPFPVIAQLHSVSDSTLGHFVLLLNSDRDEGSIVVWNGLAGPQSISRAEFSRVSTGRYLITAPEPIVDSSECFQPSMVLAVGHAGVCLSAIFLGGYVIYTSGVAWKSRSRSI